MSKKNLNSQISGFILVDKPIGLGSTETVHIIRHLFQVKKAGHSGTLDPFASGLLVIALNEATKALPYIILAQKSYDWTLQWGTATNSYDKTGKVIATSNYFPKKAELEQILPQFVGQITQIPPIYSALKIKGQRAYDLARSGVEFELPSRQVIINELTLTHYDATTKTTGFSSTVSSGTYIRSLGYDLAKSLGGLAHVTELRRKSIQHFSIKNAFSLANLEKMSYKQLIDVALLPITAQLVGIPAVVLVEQDIARLRLGQAITLPSKLNRQLTSGFIEIENYTKEKIGELSVGNVQLQPGDKESNKHNPITALSHNLLAMDSKGHAIGFVTIAANHTVHYLKPIRLLHI